MSAVFGEVWGLDLIKTSTVVVLKMFLLFGMIETLGNKHGNFMKRFLKQAIAKRKLLSTTSLDKIIHRQSLAAVNGFYLSKTPTKVARKGKLINSLNNN